MSQIGENIKIKRKEYGLTMEQLASLIHTSKQTIARYEDGTIQNIPYEKIEALAEALHVTPSTLMGWEDKSVPSFVPGTAELIDLYSKATVEQRQAVISLLRSFVITGNT